MYTKAPIERAINTEIYHDLYYIDSILKKKGINAEAKMELEDFISELQKYKEEVYHPSTIQQICQSTLEILRYHSASMPELEKYIEIVQKIWAPISSPLHPNSEIIIPPRMIEEIYINQTKIAWITELPPGVTHKNQVN